MLKYFLTLAMVSLLPSAGIAAAEPVPGVSLTIPAQQKSALKKGGYCTGLSLKELGCNPQLPTVTTVAQIYEHGWRVVSDVIGSYGYHFVIIEEQ
ncbi:MAG: hypothetical protein PHR30_15130 [Gallionellaceae bacterium]|nr:hypothetical protein [Gallionellaceae bacterium]